MALFIQRALILISAALLLSCSKKAEPETAGPSAEVACNQQDTCPSGEKCDFTFPSGSQAGQCRTICSATGKCPAGEVCSPISGACEPSCAPASNLCQRLNLPNSITATCILPQGYCAIPVSSGCPANFSPSNGFCKFSMASGCTGYQLKSDPVTQTCEVGCGQDSDCSSLASLQSLPATPVSYGCSASTNTCVAKCNMASGTCVDSTRALCYSLGYAGTTGTCEQPCSQTCRLPLQCAEGICQTPCSSDNDCSGHGKRTRCDVISGACGLPCDSLTSGCGTGLACSPVSATCVATCSGSNTCPSQDTKRNGCLNYTSWLDGNEVNACEVGCTGHGTKENPLQGACSNSQYCAFNPNNSGKFVSGYCGQKCDLAQCANGPSCNPASVCGF